MSNKINPQQVNKQMVQKPGLITAHGNMSFNGNYGKLFVPAPIAKWFKENQIHRVLFVVSELGGTVLLKPLREKELKKELERAIKMVNHKRVLA